MMNAKDVMFNSLAAVVGDAHVTTARENLEAYATDQSFEIGRPPRYAVFPENAREIAEIVRLANEQRMPVVPKSSTIGLYGGALPMEGGIVLDLKRMNRIIEVNERNWYAVVEPGVTFQQLHSRLLEQGLRVAKPLMEPPSASVISTYMERVPSATAADFVYGMEHVISYTVVAPSGETFTVGHPPLENTPASAPDGPGLNFYRIFQGAQGTLGIVTWMVIRVLPRPATRKVFFFPCPGMEKAIEIIRCVQKKELGLECFALNNFNMAAWLVGFSGDQTLNLRQGKYLGTRKTRVWAENQYEEFQELRRSLPAWTTVVCLSAVGPIPHEKIAYQEIDLKEAVSEIGAFPESTVGGVAALDKEVLDELALPWRMQKRYGYRGSCHSMMFNSPPDRIAALHKTASRVAQEFGYPPEDMGIYILPMERARAFYCTYELHCNPDDPSESQHISNLFHRLSEVLVEHGGFFDRPYGKWASLVYSRTGNYSEYLRKIKKELDPNNIMNPGKLCF